MIRHFLDLDQFDRSTLSLILKKAHLLKKNRTMRNDLRGRALAMVFEKPSTRTRVSFELAMKELGGNTVVLTAKEMQLGHSESIGDTARVLSRFVQAMMIRTFEQSTLQELANHAGIPIINGLTNVSHPCQVMADLMTVEERLNKLKGLRVAWLGDGNNNVLTSWIQAAALFEFTIAVACPTMLAPEATLLSKYSAHARCGQNPQEALAEADVVLTDTWVSMHQHSDVELRKQWLRPYQVDTGMMGIARPHAIFLHCLPAHRGEEVVDAVIDGPQSAVWDEAENRLHVQKAILLWCFDKL